MTGCSTPRSAEIGSRRSFEFRTDTLAFQNETVWEYYHDADGDWKSRTITPRPDYTLHCFVLARSVRQFHLHARFDPLQPRASMQTYRALVRDVVDTDPRGGRKNDGPIVIPGFANLREFSLEHETLLKEECGGAWQSYFQRGHWRMVFPFSRTHQARAADEILTELADGIPLVLHLVRFPDLSINHAVLAFGARSTPQGIEFDIYDPNNISASEILTFDADRNRFEFPPNRYWSGGPLRVYPVFHRWNY